MKKYAFPFTLGIMCFIGGYMVNLSERRLLQSQLDSARTALSEFEGNRYPTEELIAAIRQGTPVADPGDSQGRGHGSSAPIIPLKVVAP